MAKQRASRASRLIEEWLSSGTADEPHTQAVLAERVSVLVQREIAQSTISQIKSGHQSPRADLVAAFRVLLSIEPEWWLPDAPDSDAAAVETDEESPKPAPSAA